MGEETLSEEELREEKEIVCKQCKEFFILEDELFYVPGPDYICFHCRRENFEEEIGYDYD